MSPTVWLIAKLCRVDAELARRALASVRAQDEDGAPVPAPFTSGQSARAYALALVVSRNTLRFYLALAGLVSFPVYLLIQYGVHLYGR